LLLEAVVVLAHKILLALLVAVALVVFYKAQQH
jgi:hypothetical protein